MSISVYRNVSQVPNVIEVIGMPAVGKSTYCEKLVSENAGYIDANTLIPENHLIRQLYKLLCGAICFFHAPAKTVRSMRVMLRSDQRSAIDLMKVAGNWFLICRLMRRASGNPGKTYVFDQGVFQAVWSILFSCKNGASVFDVLRGAQCPSRVVFLDEPDEVIRDREAGRDKTIRLNYSEPEHIKNARAAIDAVVAYLDREYEREEAGPTAL